MGLMMFGPRNKVHLKHALEKTCRAMIVCYCAQDKDLNGLTAVSM